MATKRELAKRWAESPGKEILDRVNEYLSGRRRLEPGPPESSDELLRVLENLPFREEVPGGRDLRSAELADLVQLDLREWDFSFLRSCGHFAGCDLTGARFDQARTAGNMGVRKILSGASFRKATFKSAYFSETTATSACFDEAKLAESSFQAADLSGASFRNADCKRVSFVEANLVGCDFRGAKLEEAVFQSASLDATTDFRGASLINAYYKDHFDNSGRLIGRGVDLRKAKHDETTKFGNDPAALDLEIVRAAIEIANEDGATKIVEWLRTIEAMLTKGPLEDWESEALKGISGTDQATFDDIVEQAYKSLR